MSRITRGRTMICGIRWMTVLLIGQAAVWAATFAVQSVQYQTDPFTQLLGINNAGTIAGFHGALTAQGFTLNLPNSFSTENFPQSAQTMVTGINNAGSTVGIYVDSSGLTHGFTDISGIFKTVDQPATIFNQGLGINSSNVTVGYSSALDPAGMVGQKAYSQSGGSFTSIDALLPSNQNSQAVGINDAGNIVGFYVKMDGTSVGFEDIGGTITTIDPFQSPFTQALGINNQGEIVGFYTDAAGAQHGYTDLNGLFTSFDPAASVNTTINGVNDLGQIVGFYTDMNDNVVGFVGTPPATAAPEPGAMAMLGAGLLFTGLFQRRRKR